MQYMVEWDEGVYKNPKTQAVHAFSTQRHRVAAPVLGTGMRRARNPRHSCLQGASIQVGAGRHFPLLYIGLKHPTLSNFMHWPSLIAFCGLDLDFPQPLVRETAGPSRGVIPVEPQLSFCRAGTLLIH